MTTQSQQINEALKWRYRGRQGEETSNHENEAWLLAGVHPLEHPRDLICPHCEDRITAGQDLFPFPYLRAKILQCPGCGEEALCEVTPTLAFAAVPLAARE